MEGVTLGVTASEEAHGVRRGSAPGAGPMLKEWGSRPDLCLPSRSNKNICC